MTLRLRAAILGDLKQILDAEQHDLAGRLTDAMADAGLALRDALRAQVRSARLGGGVEKSWNFKVYPRPPRESLGPAALVYTKAPKIVTAFDEGAIVKSAKGFFLAIPTEAAPKKGIGGKRISPSNWPGGRFGKLRLVFGRRGFGMLVADVALGTARSMVGQNRRPIGQGGRWRASARKIGEGKATVVMFFLVPQVKMPKLLNVAAAEKLAESELYSRVARAAR